MPTQPLGWFKKPIAKVADLKGLKYRTVGLSIDIFKELGAAVNPLPGGEIVPALERGVIDGAEFNNPSSDRVLGFPDVAKNYMIQSYHQPVECFEVLFNKPKYDALPAELQAMLRHSAEAASADMSLVAAKPHAPSAITRMPTPEDSVFVTPCTLASRVTTNWRM
jgi:TRAP-type mannitol/chloroaromatic compound transport system substrate-binding protein